MRSPVPRLLVVLTMTALLAGWPAAVRAGGEAPCRSPLSFPGAAVNTAVVQFQYSGPRVRELSETARRLSRMVQLDALLSQLKYTGIGVVHLVRESNDPDECDPELVARRLLGALPGASRQVQPGRGLVVLSGRLYEEAGEVYVQNQLRFLRRGQPERFSLTIPGSLPFKLEADLPFQALSFPARRLTGDDLRAIDTEFIRSSVLYPQPAESAGGSPVPFVQGVAFAYQVVEVRGEWMRVQSDFTQGGWIRARTSALPLRKMVPELHMVDAAVGYLEERITRDKAASPKPAVRAGALAQAALADYERAERAVRQQNAERAVRPQDATRAAAVPLAAARAIDAVLRMLESVPPVVAAMETARTETDDACRLVPYSADLWNLKAVAGAFFLPRGGAAAAVVDDLLNAAAVEPKNRLVLANLEALYAYLRAAGPPAPFTAADLDARIKDVQAVRAATPAGPERR